MASQNILHGIIEHGPNGKGSFHSKGWKGDDWVYDVDKVIEAVKEMHPEWAFRQCAREAGAIMDAGRSGEYDVAAEWVRRGRDILLAAGLDQLWQEYIERIMDVHQRKYKLMPMLRALI